MQNSLLTIHVLHLSTSIGRTPTGACNYAPFSERRVLRRVLMTAFEKILRRILRRCLAVGFNGKKGSEKGS